MQIAVVGTTLQAGVMATLFAEVGHYVTWLQGDTPYDGELHERITKVEKSGHLTHFPLTEPLDNGVEICLMSFRPSEEESAHTFLNQLAKGTYPKLSLMINGSTFGINGTERLQQHLPHLDWCYLPDTIQEGNAFSSFLEAKEVVVGIESPTAMKGMVELLRPFFPFKTQYLKMPILDAELTKLAISGMLATRISYINDLANVAETLGVDILNIRQGMAADSRIGGAYLAPGTGFGGEHFSHDILMLSSEVEKSGAKSRLMAQVWAINEEQKELLFRKVWRYYRGDLTGKRIGIWGAAFKEESSSTHNSPIHPLLEALWAQGAMVQLHDPEALPEISAQYGERPDLHLCHDPYSAAEQVDALLIVTPWRSYYSPNYEALKRAMKHPLILDGRNIYDPQYMKEQGFIYQGVGRL